MSNDIILKPLVCLKDSAQNNSISGPNTEGILFGVTFSAF